MHSMRSSVANWRGTRGGTSDTMMKALAVGCRKVEDAWRVGAAVPKSAFRERDRTLPARYALPILTNTKDHPASVDKLKRPTKRIREVAMQISNAASSPTAERVTLSSNAATDQQSVSDDNVPAQTTQTAQTTQATNPAVATEQDSAVAISPEGAAMAAQDPGSEQTSSPNVSAIKSLAYGTLGLERPDQPKQNDNEFYTAGRWIAAGLTVGGIISLLV
jgi:hypothetical protein